jgi:hypothetical protein
LRTGSTPRAGQPVEVVVAAGLVEILHAGVVVATHAQRLRADQADRAPRARVARRARDATAGLTVTRLADGAGVVSFAGTPYACGRRWARTAIDVTIVAGSVQLSKDGKVIRIHPIRHDRARELGAFANPQGRPAARTPPPAMSPSYRNSDVARVPELDTAGQAVMSLSFEVWPVSGRHGGGRYLHRLPDDGDPGHPAGGPDRRHWVRAQW